MDPFLRQHTHHHVYRDRLDLPDDFEVLHSRIASTTDRGRHANDSDRFPLRGTKWTIGTEWAPKDDPELDLDTDDDGYEDAMDADLAQVVKDSEAAKIKMAEEAKEAKKKRSETSVSSSSSPGKFMSIQLISSLQKTTTSYMENESA